MISVRLNAGERRPDPRLKRNAVAGRRLTKLTVLLGASTILVLMWIVWRYGPAASSVARLPEWMIDGLGLLTWSGLLTLSTLWGLVIWQRHVAGAERQTAMTLAQLYGLSPRDFEHYVGELFEKKGYQVTVRGRSGDLGVDLELLDVAGRRAIVQCKRYRHPIGPDVVRELFGTMLHEFAFHGYLVTTAEISAAAREWARGKPITLIDGRTLVSLVSDPKHK